MADQRFDDRSDLLADVAESYFLKGKTQAQIANTIGVTRSMVSRMLTEARKTGIVKILINRPHIFNHELEHQLVNRFGLKSAHVVNEHTSDSGLLVEHMGGVAAQVLKSKLAPAMSVGVVWGAAVGATIDALEVEGPIPVKVVQLVGALGARDTVYDGRRLVQQLVEKLSGEGFYMNAPFMVESPETAREIMNLASMRETLDELQHCDLALVGIGSVSPTYSSFYKAGHLPLEVLRTLEEDGTIGGICGFHFDIYGCPTGQSLLKRVISINREDFLSIPVRIGVAGGSGKVRPILGALRGNLVNVLVTDNFAAREVLMLDEEIPG